MNAQSTSCFNTCKGSGTTLHYNICERFLLAEFQRHYISAKISSGGAFDNAFDCFNHYILSLLHYFKYLLPLIVMVKDCLGVVKRIDTNEQTTNERTNNEINTQQQRDNNCKSISLL